MDNINYVLTKSIEDLIKHSSDSRKIRTLEKKHSAKLHFIPYRYRIFGGILQSMNIQFGNFIEKVMSEVLKINPDIEIIEKYSGKKGNSFVITSNSEEEIDRYITACQIKNYDEKEFVQKFQSLIAKIRDNEANTTLPTNKFNHDVDALFRRKSDNTYYYMEMKYNDDHDTGKFIDINRKLLKTYAYLQRELGYNTELRPLLFYFTNKRMKGNIYLPEDLCIYRGKRFFDEFTTIEYSIMDEYMKNISENQETIKSFDELYNRVIKQC